MKLMIVSLVLVLIHYSSLCDGAAANHRTRSGKPLISSNREEEKQRPFPDDVRNGIVLPEPLRILAEKIELLKNGHEVSLQDLPPDIRDALRVIENICESDRNNCIREGRGLLSNLGLLSALHFNSLFNGSGNISASQTMAILGRIIRSALTLSYGPENANRPGLPIANDVPYEPETGIVVEGATRKQGI